MDGERKEAIATVDDELALFVRASPEALAPAELDLVAGGTGSCIIPNGG